MERTAVPVQLLSVSENLTCMYSVVRNVNGYVCFDREL